MSTEQKFIVLPFRRNRKALSLGEMRTASSAASAERLAAAMATRFAGVQAFEVQVETESGEMREPRLICAHGETLDLTSDV